MIGWTNEDFLFQFLITANVIEVITCAAKVRNSLGWEKICDAEIERKL